MSAKGDAEEMHTHTRLPKTTSLTAASAQPKEAGSRDRLRMQGIVCDGEGGEGGRVLLQPLFSTVRIRFV